MRAVACDFGRAASERTHRSTWASFAAPVATSGRLANRDQRRAMATVKNRFPW